ncbi:unnamed protein product (macronuclear) [Paramecium tetraurelia]|uniref:C3H1-type domain-containing protein n=1 Tax=Paramecium tetraurelia TaxID=5888 RepID=A0CJW1_PARTE|nr:uncharacterized protein GSPATT00000790001 [Paramecium tetraurelia]CAK71078.1 unnamed protein product [Paramecium tetraurelia]|eukprot:XP_001438475.1 hypothetical protein (macronuclear) [Paramecium tetraurelia strain d4-2]
MEHNFKNIKLEIDHYIQIQFDQCSTDEEEKEFEIGVKPNKKKFNNSLEKKQFIEEYTKKKKTELCKNFTLTGSCKFGSNCSYAHGQSELLPKAHLHQNYKTKPCKNFLNYGWCNYGSRCQYIHPENSLKKLKHSSKNSKHNNYDSDLQKLANKCNSQGEGQQTLTIQMLYSELLQKLNSSSQICLKNLTRLSYFKRLGQVQSLLLSDDSDP